MKHLLQSLAEDNEELRITNYSGRSMYGERCLGIIGRNEFIIAGNLLSAAEPEDIHVIAEAFLRTHVDNMGRDIVAYWPNIPFDGEEPREDEDDDED